MQVHSLKNKNADARKRVGRGGKRGKTSGKGMKGQNARTGNSKRPEIRDFIKKFPKLRGQGKNGNRARDIITYHYPVNLSTIEKNFENGDIVSPKILVQKGIVDYRKAQIPSIKILATGEITKKVTFSNCLVSKSARDKIEHAGGVVK